jgi:hypothetical protein
LEHSRIFAKPLIKQNFEKGTKISLQRLLASVARARNRNSRFISRLALSANPLATLAAIGWMGKTDRRRLTKSIFLQDLR